MDHAMPRPGAAQSHDDATGGRPMTEDTLMRSHNEPARIELLACVAHELRNPLQAIQSAVRVLGASNLSEPLQQEARTLIDRQVLRIARLSDDLLAASRLTLGRLELRRERIDLRALVNAAADACRAQLDASRQRLVLLVPPDVVDVHVDPLRITQVITNLLDNAAKYSEPDGMIVVSIEKSRTDTAIHVLDQGMGIAPDFLPRIFDMFSQADEARARACHGLGIGLHLVRRIVELHAGTVRAFSPGPGLGSTFTVRLPSGF
jgi:signal transduction histidine kinase